MTLTKMSQKEKKRQEVLGYANRLSALLSAKKRLSILEADIWKNFKELEYIQHKIDQKSKKLEETISAIKTIEPKLSEAKKRLNSVEPEKEALENEYLRLQDIQKNLDKKKLDLEENRDHIALLLDDISKAGENIRLLENTNQSIIANSAEADNLVNSNRAKLIHLQDEIEVNINTRKLMEGIKPDSIGNEEFRALQINDENVEAYQAEATDIINRMKDEMAAMTSRISEISSLEAGVIGKIKSLESKIEALKKDISTAKGKEELLSEIEALVKNRKDLTLKLETCRKKKSLLTSEITEIKGELTKETEFKQTCLKNIDRLTMRKKEMENIENIDQEMERIKQRIEDMNMETTGNHSFLQILNRICQETKTHNNSLKTRVDTYLAAMDQYFSLLLLSNP
ncbi:Putative ATPase involved in DNA repair or chromosome segregation [Desulfamplus magnetovallimortis]|uniref:Putative ATPase involved in DNA repair or chromosome segregation n=1 Tax=Desulfamplus magnetovallimortis TaxID=1246637 RepID=L0R5D4_9BACT|nr:hypothetical protein [Desulfamplus magnetovallimortis]CCO06722.1 Putative ATPase involved in DNA repair or chromosome segregation [Desulfamplus magnetovallimortis BW-1]SLM32773.1 Putative ATPase involved in DNA repair or chromosome segregation [Desulfamplus magnetovallimortis]